MRTSELEGAALDWAVAEASGVPIYQSRETLTRMDVDGNAYWKPSTNWAQGGEIIERERICLIDQSGDYWQALCGWTEAFGETPLIAAMRCFVASKLGDEVEIPEGLNGQA